jgi:hypothetical protein
MRETKSPSLRRKKGQPQGLAQVLVVSPPREVRQRHYSRHLYNAKAPGASHLARGL